MASANRLMELRQPCLNNSRIAEISVPAWPIPIHQTKLMMANPQATGCVIAQMPTPFRNSQVTATSSIVAPPPATVKSANQPIGVCRRQHDARDLLGDRQKGLALAQSPGILRLRDRSSGGIASGFIFASWSLICPGSTLRRRMFRRRLFQVPGSYSTLRPDTASSDAYSWSAITW